MIAGMKAAANSSEPATSRIQPSPPGTFAAQATMITEDSTAHRTMMPASLRLLGLGKGSRLTASTATQTTPPRATGSGGDSTMIDTTVKAQSGAGMPRKMPGSLGAVTYRASRTTIARKKAAAATSAGRARCWSSKPAQASTIAAGTSPKVMTSARLSRCGP
ncbi:hypothetical protein GCM10010468_40460 [Actinocorallia longicatena]|uniref:Uncharacterized protein n=1 Tax=Actinocorallia longicatena TaxID=111803 RepID=A0ABP6QBE3_9ACTN